LDSLTPTRPCWVEILTRALEENYRLLCSLAPPSAECLAIVKADAYGHSLALCAPAAAHAGARWLGVTSVEEGIAVRELCPSARILIMGGAFPGQAAALIEHKLTPVVWDAWQFAELEAAACAASLPPGSLPVHLETDTGMSRQGASFDELPAILSRFTAQSPLALEAVMTHLYAADETDGEITMRQLKTLDEALARVAAALPADAPRPRWLSAGASASLLTSGARDIAELAARHRLAPMLRIGLALYGVIPEFLPPFPSAAEPAPLAAARAALRPILAWKTRVTSVRSVPTGAEVGYNGTFIATEPMRLALIAAGYADGLNRSLSNRFSLLVRGQRAPLAGRISMDQAVLDVTEIPGVDPGDEVVILGEQNGESITAHDHARASGTIPWEVFTRIAARVCRVEADS
jgi:alanine racemase